MTLVVCNGNSQGVDICYRSQYEAGVDLLKNGFAWPRVYDSLHVLCTGVPCHASLTLQVCEHQLVHFPPARVQQSVHNQTYGNKLQNSSRTLHEVRFIQQSS